MKKIFITVILLIAFGIDAQWMSTTLPYQGYSNKIDFYNVNSGISCGYSTLTNEGKIFYTTNSGLNWSLSAFPPELRYITDIQYISSSVVYASGAENIIPAFLKETDYTYKRIFLKSTNSGFSWDRVVPFDTMSGKFDNIHFFNQNTGYAIENVNRTILPTFYKTTNGGFNWIQLSTLDVDFVIQDMEFLNENIGFLAGYVCCGINAMIFKTVNGGLTWKSFNYQLTDDFTGINFFNSTTGIVIGRCTSYYNGTKIYRTQNAGESWDSVASFKDVYPSTVKALNGTGIAFATGYPSLQSNPSPEKTYTFKTTDFGLTWISKNFNSYKVIKGCSLIDQNNFFLSGGDSVSSAVIMKSTNGGSVFVKSVSGVIPDYFFLYQNFPNPFNPSTTIRYNVESFKVIKLVVYDNLGKVITTLVNNKQSPGTYEVTFDGSQYPSGVYFYTLESQNFKEIKRMVLIK